MGWAESKGSWMSTKVIAHLRAPEYRFYIRLRSCSMLNVSYATCTGNVLSVHFCSDYAFSTATRLSATAIPSDDTLSVFFNTYSFGYLCS
jgi:hypothetical protein